MILFRHKEEGNLATPGMDLEGIMLREISQTEKDKYTKTKHKTKPKLLDTEDRLKVARGTRKEIGTMGKGS